MEALPESFLCVLRDIASFEEAVTRMVASVQEKRTLLTNAACRSLGISPPSDFSLPETLLQSEPPPPHPRVAAALMGLGEVAETTLKTLKREAHAKLDQILSHYYNIDLSPLFAYK
mmetsp:Transcript_32230/g.63967  ORF Transcript_32230/g.63967 Transcript_32230/m.63967 type:complete len:116 (-) Transcript_32230:1472-1819(-)